MGVKFLNQNITTNTVRPTGFKFPVGLSTIYAGTGTVANNSVDYLVVAGGGAGHQEARGGGGGAGGFRVGSGISYVCAIN